MYNSFTDHIFEVKYLMGMGLGLKKHGIHVAFAAGTGILVFIDLVALLIKFNLGLID